MIDNVRKRPLLVIACLLGVLLVVGVLTFAGPCVHEDGSTSACHDASVAILVAGVASALAALVALISSNHAVTGALSVIAAFAAAFAAFAPGNLFGLCMMQTMRCWTIMKPFALVCGGAIALLALIQAVIAFRNRGR